MSAWIEFHVQGSRNHRASQTQEVERPKDVGARRRCLGWPADELLKRLRFLPPAAISFRRPGLSCPLGACAFVSGGPTCLGFRLPVVLFCLLVGTGRNSSKPPKKARFGRFGPIPAIPAIHRQFTFAPSGRALGSVEGVGEEGVGSGVRGWTSVRYFWEVLGGVLPASRAANSSSDKTSSAAPAPMVWSSIHKRGRKLASPGAQLCLRHQEIARNDSAGTVSMLTVRI